MVVGFVPLPLLVPKLLQGLVLPVVGVPWEWGIVLFEHLTVGLVLRVLYLGDHVVVP